MRTLEKRLIQRWRGGVLEESSWAAMIVDGPAFVILNCVNGSDVKIDDWGKIKWLWRPNM